MFARGWHEELGRGSTIGFEATTYRDGEEAVRRLEHTRRSVPPRGECGDQAGDSGSLGDSRVHGTVGTELEVGDGEKEESDIEEEEQGEEGNSRLESAQEAYEGEDEPSVSEGISDRAFTETGNRALELTQQGRSQRRGWHQPWTRTQP